MINIPKKVLEGISKKEEVSIDQIKAGIKAGHIVIPKNNKRDFEKPCAIGKGMTTKVNANIGLSSMSSDIDHEFKKMEVAVKAGADTIMDLSTGPLVKEVRKRIMEVCTVPLGTVPVYDLACDKDKPFISMEDEDFLDVLRNQAKEGVDFFTIHSGLTLKCMEIVKKNPRILNIVSRGGALLASWMLKNNKENPLYSRFDEVIDIAKEYDIVLSLGDSLRPGAICDATDELQITELITLGELQKRALSKGVQVIIEGPGHVSMDQIETNVRLQKTICNGAPFYVLGPLVTDAGAGYDHIVGAIGGAMAAWYGADYLCYVTPAEHLCLPDLEDVHKGVIASKIAAHAADIAKKIPSAIKRDLEISKARAKRDWPKQFELCLDSGTPKRYREKDTPDVEDVCTMCSEYCSIKIMEECLEEIEGKEKVLKKRKKASS
jgi:phosphomethylpyrimidine synthase